MSSAPKAGLLASHAELAAHDERSWVAELGVTPIEQLRPRVPGRVAGVLRSVTYAPAGSATALRAELYDGSGAIELRWTGRRDIPGITPGRRLLAEGMVAQPQDGGEYTIHNPRYELLTRPGRT